MAFTISCDAFDMGGAIPSKFTCDGEDVSPHLAWNGIPVGTKSFVLIMDDPDAPGRTFVHWVLYDLPGLTRELSENMPKTPTLSNGAKQGTNDYPRVGYGGPCPPRGKPHRYYFKLYALDTILKLEPRASKLEVEEAMKGHIKAKAEYMGTYQR
jgi:hypothetical protein